MSSSQSLIHPLYLDVEMMISFLAFLEGGVSIETEESIRTDREREVSGTGSAKIKMPHIATLLGLEAKVEAAAAGKSTDSSEYKAARHHTAASLFNYLYTYLHEQGKLTRLSDPNDLSNVETGALVETAGRYEGNPLEVVLDFFHQTIPYVEDTESDGGGDGKSDAKHKKDPRRSGNPAGRAKAHEIEVVAKAQEEAEDTEQTVRRLINRMHNDLENASIRDVVLELDSGLRAVLTVASQYYSPRVKEALRSGNFRAIGKVTRVLTDEETINLARRTVMGAAGPEVTRGVVMEITEDSDVFVEATNPIVTAPAVQILPMAIFV